MRAAVIGGGFAGLSFARSFPGDVTVYNVGVSGTAGAVSLPAVKAFKLQEFFPEECVLYKARSVKVDAYGSVLERSFKDPVSYVMDVKGMLAKMAEGLRVEERRIRPGDVPGLLEANDLVVGADGVFSSVRSYLGVPPPGGDDLHVGVQVDVKVPNPEDYADVEVHFNELSPKGYVWSFRIGEREFRAGFGVPAYLKVGLADRLNEVLKFLFKKGYATTGRPFGGFIPTSKPLEGLRYGRIHLVGDSAGMCDPLTGGGMVYALAAGRALAENDVKALRGIQGFLADRYLLKGKILAFKPGDWRRLVGLADKLPISPPLLTPSRVSGLAWRLLSRCLP